MSQPFYTGLNPPTHKAASKAQEFVRNR